MFCRNCGKDVSQQGTAAKAPSVCKACGFHPLTEKNFCQGCGTETKPNQLMCVKCNEPLKNAAANTSGVPAHGGTPLNTNFDQLSPYYREEFQKILDSNESYKGKVNWAAAFFGLFWALSKNLWLPVVIFILVGIFTGGIVTLIYWLLFPIRANYLYYCLYVKDKHAIW